MKNEKHKPQQQMRGVTRQGLHVGLQRYEHEHVALNIGVVPGGALNVALGHALIKQPTSCTGGAGRTDASLGSSPRQSESHVFLFLAFYL